MISFLRQRGAAWLPALLGVVYFLGGVVVGQARFAYELDPDEGYNLVKVQLVERGFRLYGEVWSDQPPIFTYLGATFVKIFGEEVEAVRLVSTLLAAALVFALADLLRRSLPGVAGLCAAVAVAVIVPVPGHFSRYSLAAMIGLPAIAWAMLSLWALFVSESKRSGFLVASGILFALSLATKLLCAFLLPLFVALALYRARSLEGRVRVMGRGAALWGGACAAGLLLGFAPALAAGGFEQLFGTHLAGGFAGQNSARLLAKYFVPDLWVYLLAMLGLGFAVRKRDGVGLLFGAWCLLAFALVAAHDPIWHHHVLLVSIPASGLAAAVFGRAAEFVAGRALVWQRALGFSALAGALLVIAFPLLEDIPRLGTLSDRNARQLALDSVIRRRAPHARTIVTSKQIRAFRLKLVVPPELAVTSTKRFRSGQLSARRVARIVSERRPDVVIVDRRWPASVRSALHEAVADGYRAVYRERESDLTVYVANSQSGN